MGGPSIRRTLLTSIDRDILSAPVAGVAVLLLLAGVVPTAPVLGDGPGRVLTVGVVSVGLDTCLHVVGYGALAATLLWTAEPPSRWSIIRAVLIATAFGAAIEMLQWPLPWRDASLLDALSNAVGAVLGVGLAGLARRFRSR